MLSYIFHNFCEPTRSRKILSHHSILWFCTTLVLLLLLMNWRTLAITSPLDESLEYQRSLKELMKNHSHPQHTTDKRFTPFWAAQVEGGESAAKDLAAKYGFIYLGEASLVNICLKINTSQIFIFFVFSVFI